MTRDETGTHADAPAQRAATASRKPTRSVSIVSTTDADEEVREATRLVVATAASGVPFERIAVLWPTQRPYARLVEHHLGAADIPWNGRPGVTLAERLVPRFLLDLLDVDRRGLRRSSLFDLLADVPLRDSDGDFVATASWERASREAGVVRDADWERRLGALRSSNRWGDDANSLRAFVTALRDDLGTRQPRNPGPTGPTGATTRSISASAHVRSMRSASPSTASTRR